MLVNKIIVEQDEVFLQEESVFFTSIPTRLVLHVKGNVCLALSSITNLEVYLEKGSHLLFEIFGVIKNQNSKIIFHNEDDVVLDFHLSCWYEGENTLEVKSVVDHRNVRNYIHIRSVEKEGSILIKATGEILENTKDTLYLEDIGSLTTHQERVKILPDLLVSSADAICNHNATISNVDRAELFYLEGLGLEEEVAIKLIKEGFLNGILQIEDLKNSRR